MSLIRELVGELVGRVDQEGLSVTRRLQHGGLRQHRIAAGAVADRPLLADDLGDAHSDMAGDGIGRAPAEKATAQCTGPLGQSFDWA